MTGSDWVARWWYGDVGEVASGKHAENVSVRFDGRRRWRGTSGRVVEGAGLGDGRLRVSRDPRLRLWISITRQTDMRQQVWARETYVVRDDDELSAGARNGAYEGIALENAGDQNAVQGAHVN